MKVTNKIKALSTMTLAAATLFLAGCQAQSNTLTFTPQSPTASMNINQSILVILVHNKKLQLILNQVSLLN